MRTFVAIIAVLIVVAAGWILWNHEQFVMAPSPTISNSPEPSETDRTCTLVPQQSLTVYMRPTDKSQVFGTLTQQDSVIISGRTADGWLGFDPAAAQAPNVGPFRFRWVKPGGPYELSGACNSVPAQPSLPPTACYIMADMDIAIRQNPAASAQTVAMMHFGDYVRTIGSKGAGNVRWIKVDTSDGSLTTKVQGWISISDVNFNGPDCDKLPAAQ